MALNASASSGSDLGFGMEFYLIDSFTKVANRIKASMASLNQATNSAVKNQINTNRIGISGQQLAAATSRAQGAQYSASMSAFRLSEAQRISQERQQQAQARAQAQASRQTSTIQRQTAAMQNFQVGYNRMMSGFSAIGGAAIFAAPVMYAIQMAGTFEQATVRLETLLKSKDKAMAFFNDLKGDALKLPNVEVLDLLKGVGDLIAGGEDAQKARGVMRDLANVVMATGGGQPQFQRASFNLAQIRNNGFASMRDIREFSTANIPLISLLKKKGIDVSKTKATYEQIIAVLADYAKENNVAEKMLNSISGQTAMFKENMKYLFADMGESLKPFYVGLMKYLNGTINSLREFTGSSFGKFILRGAMLVLMFASLTTLAYGLFKVFGGIKMMFMSMSGAAGGLVPMLRSIVFTMVGLYAISKLLTSGKGSLIALGLAIAVIMGPMGMLSAALIILSSGFQEWQNFMNGGTSLGAFGKIAGVLQGIWEIINNITENGWTMNAALVKRLDDAGILGTVQKIGQIVHFLYKWWKQITFLIVTFKALWFVMGNIKKIKDAWSLFTMTLSVAKFTLSTFGSLFTGVAAAIMRGIVAINALLIGLPLGWILAAILAIGVALALIFGPEEWRTYAKDAVYALWQGFIEFFKPFQDWLREKMVGWFDFINIKMPYNADPSKDTDMNEGKSYGTGFDSYSYTPSDYMKDNGSDMRETQATQLRGAMSAINIQQASQQGLQDQNINVFLDGDLMYSKMKDKGAFEQARYG